MLSGMSPQTFAECTFHGGTLSGMAPQPFRFMYPNLQLHVPSKAFRSLGWPPNPSTACNYQGITLPGTAPQPSTACTFQGITLSGMVPQPFRCRYLSTASSASPLNTKLVICAMSISMLCFRPCERSSLRHVHAEACERLMRCFRPGKRSSLRHAHAEACRGLQDSWQHHGPQDSWQHYASTGQLAASCLQDSWHHGLQDSWQRAHLLYLNSGTGGTCIFQTLFCNFQPCSQ